MKVLFDARWIYEKPSGIGVYAQEMIRRLPELLDDWEFVLIFGSEGVKQKYMESLPEGRKNVEIKVVPLPPTSLKSQLSMPGIIKEIEPDIYHSPNYIVPYMAFPASTRTQKTRCVVNIHDVIPLVVTDYAPNSKTSRFKLLYKLCLRQSIKKSHVIITGSKASQRDISDSLNLPVSQSEKISVILDGAEIKSGSKKHAPIKTDDTTPRTLLYVGRMDPYKNVAGLIEAVSIAKNKLPFPVKLVVCGSLDPRYPEAQIAAEQFGVKDNVVFTDFVPAEELERLYSTSDLLTHPSLYEGFGLQIIEAMAHGLPVICTDGGSQPEVGGDAARVVRAGDSRAMAEVIAETLLAPPAMEEMREAGLARAAQFTWKACAEKTAALYESIQSNNGS
jgi:glycosyltransferase involved in cell wall biosynthesis